MAIQVYKGMNNEYVSMVEVVEVMVGQVMIYNGKVILVVFYVVFGGYMENVEDVWMLFLFYLWGVVDYD